MFLSPLALSLRATRSGARRPIRTDALPIAPSKQPAFVSFYDRQSISAAANWSAALDALDVPLPLDVWASPRAPLAERAIEKLRDLVDPSATSEQFLGAWQLCAADGGGAPGGDHHRFVHAQQVRCAVQRQELASQLPAVLLRPRGSHRVLDLCAAPGSKSCQLLEQLEADGGGGLLVSNDASLDRAISLNHRLQAANVASRFSMVTSLDGRWWPPSFRLRFDRVLVDVPCSGDGMRRRRQAATPPWDEGDAYALHQTQVRLLRQGLLLLEKRGGLLVYSTCALNPVENEAVVAEALRGLTTKDGAPLFEVAPFDELLPPAELAALPPLADGVSRWAVDADAAPATAAPPAEDEIAWLAPQLARCRRLLPSARAGGLSHGGFFLAALRATEAAAEAAAEAVEAAETLEGPSRGGAEAEADNDDDLEPLAADEWASIREFYGIADDGDAAPTLIWAPQRAAYWKAKAYWVSEGARHALLDVWQPARRLAPEGRLAGRLQHAGVKAFERLKLGNFRQKDAFRCTWRLSQHVLPAALGWISRRTLTTTSEPRFARVLSDGGLSASDLRDWCADGRVGGGPSCADAAGDLEAGGAVLSLLGGGGEVVVSVAVVLAPGGGLTVYAPATEVKGLLDLLEAPEGA